MAVFSKQTKLDFNKSEIRFQGKTCKITYSYLCFTKHIFVFSCTNDDGVDIRYFQFGMNTILFIFKIKLVKIRDLYSVFTKYIFLFSSMNDDSANFRYFQFCMNTISYNESSLLIVLLHP